MEEAPAASGPLSPLLGSVISSFCQEVFYLFFIFFLLPCLGGEAQRRKARYKEGLSYGRAAYFPSQKLYSRSALSLSSSITAAVKLSDALAVNEGG